MTPEQRDLLIKAADRLKAAKFCYQGQFYEDTASRAYYSMFDVAQALLLDVGFTSASHRGIISAFGEKLARTSQVPRDFGRTLNQAAELRREADYGPPNAVTAEQAAQSIERAEQFLELGDRLIAQ